MNILCKLNIKYYRTKSVRYD